MITDLLWFVDARYQYKKQKQIGMAGFIGLLLALLIFWKWHLFYPVIESLGIVALAHKMNLVNEDMGAYTLMNLALLALYSSIIVGAVLLATAVLGSVLKVFGASDLGTRIVSVCLTILFLPLYLVLRLFKKKTPTTMEDYYKADKKLRNLLKEYADQSEGEKMFSLYQAQAIREGHLYSYMLENNVENHLNRAVASIEKDRNWLIGHKCGTDEIYVLFPNPLPAYASRCAKYDVTTPYKSIWEYAMCDTEKMINEFKDNGFFVPALKIKFEWNVEKSEIVPVEIPGQKIELVNTKMLLVVKLDARDTTELFNTVSTSDSLSRWIKHAHVMVYYIPEAYPSDSQFAAEKYYYHAVKDVPYVDVYYPIYTADVELCREHFEGLGIKWSTYWEQAKIHSGEVE